MDTNEKIDFTPALPQEIFPMQALEILSEAGIDHQINNDGEVSLYVDGLMIDEIDIDDNLKAKFPSYDFGNKETISPLEILQDALAKAHEKKLNIPLIKAVAVNYGEDSLPSEVGGSAMVITKDAFYYKSLDEIADDLIKSAMTDIQMSAEQEESIIIGPR